MNMSANGPSVIDESTFSVRRTISIAAPVEKVWTAVTDPEQISRWFGRAAFDGSGAGALGTLTWPDRDPIPVRIEAIDPPRMIAYRWPGDDASGLSPAAIDDDHSTVFTFTLEPTPDGTRLEVIETGFETTSDPLANLKDHRGGWDSELDELVALLETGS